MSILKIWVPTHMFSRAESLKLTYTRASYRDVVEMQILVHRSSVGPEILHF